MLRETVLPAGKTVIAEALREIFSQLGRSTDAVCTGAQRKSDFFRDIAGSRYLAVGETVARELGLSFDMLLNVYDRSIIEVENHIGLINARLMMFQALNRIFEEQP